MFPKKKETIYNGAIGIKETFWDSAVDTKCRLVGFLKQAKNCVCDWPFRHNAIACEFPHRCPLLKKSVRPIPAENKRTQLCLQTELAEEKSQSLHSQKLPRWAQQIYLTKEKIVTPNVIKSFVCRPEIFWQNLSSSPAWPENTGPSYNSAPCQKFHSKSSACITTQKYIWD